MNNISWLVYAAEVLPSLSDWLVNISLAAGLAVAAFFLFSMVVGVEESYHSEETKASKAEVRSSAWASLRKFIPWVVAGCLLSVFIPSKTTIYMIAASEIGETVVTSPEAQEMLGDLKSIIKKRLKDEIGATAPTLTGEQT